MRGVVTIAGAFGVPLATRGREEILLLAFAVTIGTLLLHGLTLPWLIRVLGVHGQESYGDLLAEAAAQQAAAAAALARLEALEAEAEGADGPDGPDGAARHPLPDQVSQRLRQWAEHRTLGAWERLGRQETEEGEPPTATFRRLRREMLAAERDTFVRYRDIGQIDDEVLRRVLRDLDLEEAALARE
jgi:CPA1 family monovalent cation:H+ antiporter